MDSSKSGTSTSVCNVTGINDLGLWVLVENREYFIPFSDYPGFRDSSVNQILDISFLPPAQLRWESLDIDIELQALTAPETFPLVFNQ
jgi:hypothetical protein